MRPVRARVNGRESIVYDERKGVGEAGAIPVPALIAEAVDDALGPWGVRAREMPLSPGAILALLDHAPRRPDCGSPPSEGHSRPARSDAPPKRPAAHCPSGSGQP